MQKPQHEKKNYCQLHKCIQCVELNQQTDQLEKNIIDNVDFNFFSELVYDIHIISNEIKFASSFYFQFLLD